MRERLLTLLLALAALLTFVTVFLHPRIGALQAARPTSAESQPDGLLGLRTWLEAEGFRTESLRERLTRLSWRTPATGNLLLVTLPASTPFRNDEAVALDNWIRNGNTLLVLAALVDRPEWAQGGVGTANDVHLLTGLTPAPVPPTPRRPAAGEPPEDPGQAAWRELIEATRPLVKPQRTPLRPSGTHPLLREVHEAVGISRYPPRRWTLSIPRDGFFLVLAQRADSQEGALWVRPDGKGTILLSALATLFSNRALAEADNARLMAAIVAASLRGDGRVIFDDEHQGLSRTYDPAKFYRDPRLYATLGVLGAVWLVWVMGGTRLRVPLSRLPAPREAELVRATGLFLARVLRPGAAARRMYEGFFARLGPDVTVDARASRWDWLENHPHLVRAEVTQLREWYADAYSDRAVPLERLHNLLVRTERQIAA
ncbi:MAG: DUF4350 domain-containing protein [Gammaproteobacteria bacterium]|nr:DUF4350 domain-containing protein [Gammaproteobacteria bacterium]